MHREREIHTHTHTYYTMYITIHYICIYIYIYMYIQVYEITPSFTVPQKGYAKRGPNRQITKKSCLSHLNVPFSWNPF